MKIALVLDDSLDKADGVQQYVVALGNWFTREGHEVHYLVGDTQRKDLPNVHSLGRNLQVHFNQNRMSTPLPVSRRKIKALLRQEQFDVLHVQMPYSPFLAGRIIKAAPKTTAVVGTFHILPYSFKESMATRILSTAVRRSRKKFDHVVSVSEPAAKFARKKFKVKSEVLPNAVSVAQFAAGKKIRKYSDGKLNIVYLGRLVERKGCMHFLQTVKLLHDQGLLHTVRVLIAGKGPLQPQLEKFVADNRLGKSVKFLGFVSEEEKPNLLASADIAVFPSVSGESFGIVLIEAMAAGADVVIAGNNRGYRYVMEGRKEQLVKPSDTQAFAKLIKHYIINGNARKRAKKWQSAKVHQYDVAVVGAKLLKIYRQALQSTPDVR